MKKYFIIKMSAYLYMLMKKGSITSFTFDMAKNKFLRLRLYRNTDCIFNFTYVALENITKNSINKYIDLHKNLIMEELQKLNFPSN